MKNFKIVKRITQFLDWILLVLKNMGYFTFLINYSLNVTIIISPHFIQKIFQNNFIASKNLDSIFVQKNNTFILQN